MIKRMCVLMIACLMMLSAFSLGIQAQETSGTCGENLTWANDEDTRTLTISGTGPMEDYGEKAFSLWIDYRDRRRRYND